MAKTGFCRELIGKGQLDLSPSGPGKGAKKAVTMAVGQAFIFRSASHAS